MTNRENYLSLIRRKGYKKMPVDFFMCPSLEKKFNDYIKEHPIDYSYDTVNIDNGARLLPVDENQYLKYYKEPLKKGTYIDHYGIAHSPGSTESFHMTKMHHPMADFDSVEQVLAYPFPQFAYEETSNQTVEDAVKMGNMQCTIWEQSWYLRGMENLFVDMMSDDPIAHAIFDKVTDISIQNAVAYTKAGADILFLGDDIGMQRTPLMSIDLYCEWLKPRLSKLISTVREIKKDMIIFYHSCGYVEPFIPHLIEAGIDVLNPVQPECMDFSEIHKQFGDKLSFHGTIGTQTTMPYGTPKQVKQEVYKNLDIAGSKGGLLIAPTHMLEPEVPVENIIAYIEACRDYCK